MDTVRPIFRWGNGRSEGLIKLARETQLLSDRVDTQIRSDSGVTCSPPPLDSVPLVVWV